MSLSIFAMLLFSVIQAIACDKTDSVAVKISCISAWLISASYVVIDLITK